eukprot:GEMP01023769.1.p1 GENE.GEMP01023769.1~~GEMP01023769.1.p1  ORF type:complete len:540 (+),score=88.80 GEMP01023769.1:60-1622(+)
MGFVQPDAKAQCEVVEGTPAYQTGVLCPVGMPVVEEDIVVSESRPVCGAKVSFEEEEEECDGGDESKIVKEKRGTLVYSTISMAMTTMGIGLLSLPGGFASSGVVPGTVLIVTCGLLTDVCLCMLVRVTKQSGAETYEGNADYFFGKWGRKGVALTVILDLYLTIVSLSNIFMKTIGYSPDCDNRTDPTNGEPAGLLRLWTDCQQDKCPGINKATAGVVGLAVIFPFLLWKSVHSIRHVSTLAMICLFTAVFIFFGIYIYAVTQKDLDGKGRPYTAIHEDVTMFASENLFQGICSMFGLSFLAFLCQFNIFPIYAELKRPEDIHKVIHISILGIATPLYLIFGLFGYLFLGNGLNSAAGNILDELSGYQAGKAASCMMAFTCLAKLPLFFNACREAIRTELRIPENWKYNVVITLIVLVLAYLIALFFNLDTISEFTGATTGALLGFIFPGLYLVIYVKSYGLPLPSQAMREWTKDTKRLFGQGWFYIIFGIIGGAIAMTGVIMTIVSSVAEVKKECIAS